MMVGGWEEEAEMLLGISSLITRTMITTVVGSLKYITKALKSSFLGGSLHRSFLYKMLKFIFIINTILLLSLKIDVAK